MQADFGIYSCSIALQSGIDAFMQYVEKEPDIMECYAVSGEYDYILKVCAKDIKSLDKKLLQIKGQNGVIKSQTMISLMEHKLKLTVLPDVSESEGTHE